jgi:hypothetical protein
MNRRDLMKGLAATAVVPALPLAVMPAPHPMVLGIDWGKPDGDLTAAYLTWFDGECMHVDPISMEEFYAISDDVRPDLR